MAVSRRLDVAGANLQRQGQLALWVPSLGQEAAQVGSAHAARAQDHIFPVLPRARRRHDPRPRPRAHLRAPARSDARRLEPRGERQLPPLHARARVADAARHGLRDGDRSSTAPPAPATPTRDAAVLVYYGDGSTSQGDANEALVFAVELRDARRSSSCRTTSGRSRCPCHASRAARCRSAASGFGMPGIRIDGNDVLASYAVTRQSLEEARAR